jgi:hypothetical protein
LSKPYRREDLARRIRAALAASNGHGRMDGAAFSLPSLEGEAVEARATRAGSGEAAASRPASSG